MPDVSFDNLAIVMAIAFGVPLFLGFVPQIRVPAVVAEIVVGIIAGPSVLGWVEADETVRIVAIVGLAFLLFLAGLELDLRARRGRILRLGLMGLALSLLLAGVTGVVLDATGLVDDPLLAAVVLCATSLGLVIGVLKEAGESTSTLGQLVICGASIGDVAAIILLSALFSTDESGTGARLVLLVEYAVLVAAIGLAVALAGRAGRCATCSSASRTPRPRSGSEARSCWWSCSWSWPSASGWRPSSGHSGPAPWSAWWTVTSRRRIPTSGSSSTPSATGSSCPCSSSPAG